MSTSASENRYALVCHVRSALNAVNAWISTLLRDAASKQILANESIGMTHPSKSTSQDVHYPTGLLNTSGKDRETFIATVVNVKPT